jgi:hypothetical protein
MIAPVIKLTKMLFCVFIIRSRCIFFIFISTKEDALTGAYAPQFYSRHPLLALRLKTHSSISTCVASIELSVPTVLRVTSFTEIAEAIIRRASINVVDNFFRPTAGHVEESKAICPIRSPINPYCPVTACRNVPGNLPRKSRIPYLESSVRLKMSARSFLPSEDSGSIIVGNKFQ